MIFIKLAFRNLLRNKKRTMTSSLIIAVGLFAVIVFKAMAFGFYENMLESSTSKYMGEGEITEKTYNEVLKIEKTINNYQEVLKSLKDEKLLSGISPRLEAEGLIKSSIDFSNIQIIGIKPDMEKDVSILSKIIKKGKYLNLKNQNNILISEKLAKKLNVGLDDKIVLTNPIANSIELASEMFRVSGIFSFGLRSLDNHLVFINYEKAKNLFNLNSAHRIILKFKNIADSQNNKLNIWKKYNKYDNKIINWEEMMPELKSMVDNSIFQQLIILVILFLIIGMSILNTLFMSIYERMFEFGVLKAIGTRLGQLRLLIILEGFIMSIFSVILGAVSSVVFMSLLNKSGGITYYKGTEFLGTIIDKGVLLIIDPSHIIKYSIIFIIFVTIISIYPALYASKITPTKALRDKNI